MMKYDVDPLTGCWLWTGYIGRGGYGYTSTGALAHTHVYVREVGPVPEGHQLDHWCRRRNCVRPEHLEPVTPGENTRRRAWAYRSKIAKCPKGHELFTHGRRTPEGGVVCRVCCGLGGGQ